MDGWPTPYNTIGEDDRSKLDVDFTMDELQEVVDKAGSNISPGLDGVTFSFVKDFWKIVKKDVWQAVSDFLSSGIMHQSWKETMIVLIPKIKNPQMLLNRMERAIHKIISAEQVAFIRGRSLSEHVLLAQEVFNKFRYSNAKKGLLAIKLDMEQAYDSMGWQTLRQSDWIIGKCGFRQGYPLSPYLFILCSQILSDAINQKKNYFGISITPSALKISHLLYADDALLFSEANVRKIKDLKSIISQYCKWSGQHVNNSKSSIMFGKHTGIRIKKKFDRILKYKVVNEITYLGVKLTLRRWVVSDFQNLLESAANKLNTWGKHLFLKSLTRCVEDSCGIKKNSSAGLHYASWELLCKPKDEGGRGLFSAVSKVGPLRTKFSWDFFMKTDSLLYNVLRNKYGKDIWNDPVKNACSPTWKIITIGAFFLRNIVRWNISNGKSINWMLDSWVLDKSFSKWPTFVNTIESSNYNLCNFILDGVWNMNQLQVFFGEQLVELISQIPIAANRNYDQLELKTKNSGKSIVALSFEALMERSIDINHWLLNGWGFQISLFKDFKTCLDGLKRCKLVHEGVEDSDITTAANSISLTMMRNFINLSSDNWDVNQRKLSNSWHPPPPGWIKINVDAALKCNNMAGIRGVVRDDKGQFLAAFGAQYVHWDIAQLELMVVYCLKNFLQDWMYKSQGVMIEGDNFNIIKVLQVALKGWKNKERIDDNLAFLQDFN
ncbi:uncharacterized protein LOC110114071 [Dendrobium catenatum]|uniref:uncharacterized protein LOC110114071 n=1 Tax=Dendrobium catenatum TaxID=906689 RepID=UPI0009F49CDC|nr:uncharacterized protein LOC110114071 [Dendrobium catenatum]